MAFAQLTYRESLRDIEACLRAQAGKLYPMGIKSRVSRSTLADANESRDWRIYADFAQSLIAIARRLYADDSVGVDLKDTVYALDASTIDLCLSVFAWAPFRSTKAAIKLHTLLDLRGNIRFSTSAMANCTTSTFWTCCCPSRVLSTSWTEDTSTSNCFIGCTRRKASLSPAPNPTSKPNVVIRIRSIEARG